MTGDQDYSERKDYKKIFERLESSKEFKDAYDNRNTDRVTEYEEKDMKDNSELAAFEKHCERALLCLFAQVESQVANDVSQTVYAYIHQLKKVIAERDKEIEELTEAYRSMGEEWHKTEQELEKLKEQYKLL